MPQHVGYDADYAVAAKHHRSLAGSGTFLSQLARVGKIACVNAAYLQPVLAQGPLDLRCDPSGFAASG
jgi:hypothetical protein